MRIVTGIKIRTRTEVFRNKDGWEGEIRTLDQQINSLLR
jgi:hypothetical protein